MPGSNVQAMQAMGTEVDDFSISGLMFVTQQVVELNNRGGGGAPPAPIDTGELRGSPRITFNAPSSEGPDLPPFSLVTHADVARSFQLQGFTLGDLIFVTWLAEHAAVIDAGRRVGSDGVMHGSLQAPDGWVEQDAEVAGSRLRQWKFRPEGGR